MLDAHKLILLNACKTHYSHQLDFFCHLLAIIVVILPWKEVTITFLRFAHALGLSVFQSVQS